MEMYGCALGLYGCAACDMSSYAEGLYRPTCMFHANIDILTHGSRFTFLCKYNIGLYRLLSFGTRPLNSSIFSISRF